MWYMIYAQDHPHRLEARRQARPAHLRRLQVLQAEGRLLLAGPLPAIDSPEPGNAGFAGSLIIAEFASQEQAQAWADADPYIEAGVYAHVTVHPFLRVFPVSDLHQPT